MFGYRKYEIDIARRYLMSGGSGGSNTITRLAMLGITLATFSLVTVLSVRAGFQYEFLNTILGTSPHVVVTHEEHAKKGTGLSYADDISAGLVNSKNVSSAFPVIVETAIASHNDVERGIQVQGIYSKDINIMPVFQSIKGIKGDIRLDGRHIGVGRKLAENFDLNVGDELKVISTGAMSQAAAMAQSQIEAAQAQAAQNPQAMMLQNEFGASGQQRIINRSQPKQTTQTSSEGSKTFKISFIFETEVDSINASRVYMDFKTSSKLFDKGGKADAIHVSLVDADTTKPAKADILSMLGAGYSIVSWKEANASVLMGMDLQDKSMFVILSILVVIASLNIVSGLVMLVRTKSSSIGILRTMGVKRQAIMRVFLMDGMMMGAVGTIMGLALGLFVSDNIDVVFDYLSTVVKPDPEMVGVEPIVMTAKYRLFDMAFAVFGSLGVSFFITLIPASKAANMNPIDALRED